MEFNKNILVVYFYILSKTVALEPHIAARYEMESGDWDQIESIYNDDPDNYNVRQIKSSEGTIIIDSDDGDDGYLMVMY